MKQRYYIAVSWAGQCVPHLIPMFGKTGSSYGHFHASTNVNPKQCQCVEKQWLCMGSFTGRSMQNPCNAKVWQNNGFTWAVSWDDQCTPHVMPMCDKTMDLQGQFHGPTHVNPIMPTPVSGQITIEVNICGHNFVTNTYLLFGSYVEAYL